jgi:hypothetical protein
MGESLVANDNVVCVTVNTLCSKCQEVVLKLMAENRIVEMDNKAVKRTLCKKCIKGFRRAQKYQKNLDS